jgi:predicted thioesterase
VAAAFEGDRCVARARLDEIVDGRKLRFAVEVLSREGRTIGVGTHERRIVDGQRS